jgi:hypothetical protein
MGFSMQDSWVCGYSQVPGIDFTPSFAPVWNDASFRIMLLLAKLVWDMNCCTVVDIEKRIPPQGFRGRNLHGWRYLQVLQLWPQQEIDSTQDF